MGKNNIEEQAAELAAKSGLSLKKAREAMKKHGGEVGQTLQKLIDRGEVTVAMLNPHLVSGELFARAHMRESKSAMEEETKVRGEIPALFEEMRMEMRRLLEEADRAERRARAESGEGGKGVCGILFCLQLG